MATLDEFYSELNKLTKNKLIEIIFHRGLPDGVTICEKVKNHIVDSTGDGSLDATGKIPHPILENNIHYVKLKSDMEVVKVKLESANQHVSSLQEIIIHQKSIIELQKSIMDVNKNDKAINLNALANNPKISSSKTSKSMNVDIVNISSSKTSKPADVSRQKEELARTSSESQGEGNTHRKHIIKGTESTSTFEGAKRMAWIYVGRASLETTEDTVLKHLENKFPNKRFSVEKLPQKETAKSRAFKVGANMEMIEQLYRGENWPRDTTVRRFRFFRPQGRTD